MLIPQFSIRWLLGLTVVCAVIFSIVGLAVRGSRWAMGVSIGIGSLVLLMAVYAGMFFLVWVFSMLKRRRGAGRSPFSQGPPPAVVLALAVLLFPAGRCCLGQNPANTQISGNLVKVSGSGLTMTIDTRWLDGPGYRPVRIVVTPTAPVPADRTLTVQVVLRNYRDRAAMRVSKDIEIPAGSGPVRATISVPWLCYSHLCLINVLEDGTLLPALSQLPKEPVGTWSREDRESPYILIVRDRPAETHELAKSLLPDGILNPFDSDSSDPTKLPLPTAMSVGLEDLPEGWINYTSLDVICISLPQLAKLARRRPKVFEVVTSWAAAGGNLWVYGVGPDWQGLPELEALAGLSPPGGTDSAAPAARGWSEPKKHFFNPSPMIWPAVNALGEINPLSDEKAPVEPPPEPPEHAHFVFREYDLGMIVALAPEDPFPGTKLDWQWVLATMGEDRSLWHDRHGLSMRERNDDYWNFLIPGVGLAPVTGFCVLISLFVLVIGPVNYLVLRRLRRLYLLAVTIPAAAAAVTFILFGYALIADGLGTRVRVRSVTQIDQRRGHAVCWARLSYYTGLAPADGLAFPADVVVLPLEHIPERAYDQSAPGRTVLWEDDQRLVAGWLGSRTPTQYVTVRSRRSEHGLDIVPRREPDRLEIRNRLGTPIERLLVRAKDGKYYGFADVADNVADGGTATAQATDPADAIDWLRKNDIEHRPKYPPGMDSGSFRSGFGRRSYRYYGSEARASQQTSRLEQTLAKVARTKGAIMPAMVPGSYVAIVAHSPEVALGVESAQEEAGYHVIFGKW